MSYIHTHIFSGNCPVLEDPNGNFNYNLSIVDGHFPVDTGASLTCNDPFYRGVIASTTCLESGNWSQPLPMCYESNATNIDLQSLVLYMFNL